MNSSIKRVLFLSLLVLLPEAALCEFKVGVIIPLSGEVQFWGQGIKRGMELIQHNYPDKISFIYEDETFCNSKLAVTAANKLLQQDKVKLIVTGCLNGTKAIQPIASRNGALILSARQ